MPSLSFACEMWTQSIVVGKGFNFEGMGLLMIARLSALASRVYQCPSVQNEKPNLSLINKNSNYCRFSL